MPDDLLGAIDPPDSTSALCTLATNPDARICKPDSPALAAVGHACRGHYARVQKLHAECYQARRLMLENLAPGTSGLNTDRVGGSQERQDAIRINALDLADRLSDWLATTPEWIVSQPNAINLLEGLRTTLNEAHSIVPWRKGREHLPIRCPECWSRAVYRDDGRDDACCEKSAGGCGKRIGEVQLGLLSEEHKAEVDYKSRELAFQLAEAVSARDAKADA